ncbi:copper chaperone PCu(A)C [Halomonas sp. E19]|uniref:copper chaperone PCu(A)C n=1 Tax=Halomonas sp. E19 TaxID=3397247 RepID=UPI0040333B3C
MLSPGRLAPRYHTGTLHDEASFAAGRARPFPALAARAGRAAGYRAGPGTRRSAGAEASAAFMVLHNPGDAEVRLVEAASPAAAALELHHHVDVDGVMQMRRIADITIPPAVRPRWLRAGCT